jgi:hypothetical protein
MSARPNTGPQDRTLAARCRELLAEGKLSVPEIAARLGKRPNYVHALKSNDARKGQRVYKPRLKRPTAKMYKRHVTAEQDTREGLPTCPFCTLLLPCTCTRPMRAADFIGRAGESRGSLVLPRPY